MSRQRNDTRSDWFALLLLLGGVFLVMIIALGARAVSSPSNSRITALETQVSQLSSEIATLQPTPTPTNTPRPTHTPTPAPTRTSTHAPTATGTPTPRPRPGSYSQTLTVIVAHANVRQGPGTAYEILDTVQQDQTFRGPFSEKDGWYRFCCVNDNQRGWIAGHLVTISSAGTASVTPTRTTTSTVTPTLRSPTLITTPPPPLGFPLIYTKYLQARGAHIVALADVNDRAMLQAREILFGMTSTRPDLFSAMTRTGLRIIIFNHRTTPLQKLPEFKDWPLAAVRTGGFAKDNSGYIVAAPEYRLKCTPILVHEIAHAIDYAIQPHASWFSEKRDSAYQNAIATGLWRGEYAATDKHEYWAVAVERHFRRQVDEAALSQKDPEIAELVFSVFGDAQIPPCR